MYPSVRASLLLQASQPVDVIIWDGAALFDLGLLVILAVSVLFAFGSQFEIIKAGPRIWRMVLWGVRSGYRYKMAGFMNSSLKYKDPELYEERMSKLHKQVAHGLLRVCQKNGGVYVKAGQTAASLTTLPPEYREMLEKLEDSVPPIRFGRIRRAFERELGHDMGEVFEEFEMKATAAASLAQVHKAKLKDGTKVAVKIQYPGLQSSLDADLAVMAFLAGTAHFLLRVTDWRWFLTEIKEKIVEELDFQERGRECGPVVGLFRQPDRHCGAEALPEVVLAEGALHGVDRGHQGERHGRA
jgi:aarF domain-containing kinase